MRDMRESRIREAVERGASDESFFVRRGQERETGNGHERYREFRPITTLTKCINCGATVMHRSRSGVDCGEIGCVEAAAGKVKKLQEQLEEITKEHWALKKEKEEMESKLDAHNKLLKKDEEVIEQLKIKLKRRDEKIEFLEEVLK